MHSIRERQDACKRENVLQIVALESFLVMEIMRACYLNLRVHLAGGAPTPDPSPIA